MGLNYQGILGNFSGKVGNIVGRQRQGRVVLSIYQPNVANPKTAEQMDNRSKLATLVSKMKIIAPYVKIGFKGLDGYKYGTPWSAFVGYNLRGGGVKKNGSNEWIVDYGLTVVALGQTSLPYNPTGTLDGNDIAVTWTDNSALDPNAEADDEAAVIALNSSKNQVFANMALAARSVHTGTLALPSAWSGDTVEVWMFMISKKGEPSKSTYLGNFTL